MIRAVAPGRVNLIGEYTDVADGLVLPMAIDLATTVVGEPGGDAIVLRSADESDVAVVPLTVIDPQAVEPGWARYVAGVVAELRPPIGFTGEVSTTVPIGAGLSSSAALEVAVALALGFDGSTLELAHLTRRAEQRASGVPCGIMDQLASAAGVGGHALLIDCGTLSVDPVPLPDDVEIRVVHSGQERRLSESEYVDRVAAIERGAAEIGPLRDLVDRAVVEAIVDPVVRRRTRHVVTENQRVRAAADAMRAGDVAELGRLMDESHRSMRDDLEISTPVVDALVERLRARPGVLGVRLTGAGFGGCLVALTAPGALDEGWLVRPSPGASVLRG